MNVLLFSNDERLADFCREVLGDMFGPGAKLEVALPGQLPSREDLCLWDFIPGTTSVPQDLDPAKLRQHFFLLHRKHLPALQELVGTSDINVLLKPVMPATLRAFLGDAHQQRAVARGNGDGDPAGSMNTLRVERDEMLQFLIQANLKLQEYDQERTNFLARSIHDFRAPLTAIAGYCDLLLEEALGSLTADQREVLGRMERSATRLSRLTESMFQLSASRNIGQEPNFKSADIRDCVEQALHEVSLFVGDKRISVAVEIDQPPNGLLFDKSEIEQTLVNLLDNACKFTPRNGTIRIKGYPFFWERRTCRAPALDPSADRRVRRVETPNSFRVDIRDSGPGIPAVHLVKIFEEYTSYSGGQDRSGGGLGLAVCRMILQRHRGHVWAESHASGAAFSFVIPVQPVDAHPPAGRMWPGKARPAGIEGGWS
jgi:signal transduction histidine kinase